MTVLSPSWSTPGIYFCERLLVEVNFRQVELWGGQLEDCVNDSRLMKLDTLVVSCGCWTVV